MLNPVTYTERVVSDFLRYQMTTYPFADRNLNQQMRQLLSLDATRATPLMRGPHISLSKSFRKGAALKDLVAQGVLHPHITNLSPHEHVYGHQETSIRHIVGGKNTLISTGTGSGKTECFLYPVISRCLHLRDAGETTGVVAVIVYPMNALAEDQLERLRELLVGTGVTFALYVGKTPEKDSDMTGVRLPCGASLADYRSQVKRLRKQKQSLAVHPPEERVSREEMRNPGKQPRILLTNVKQLELLLTRQRDVELFENARLEFTVFDEAHTFSGATGAETACLIRRLRVHCGRTPDDMVCVATSATIADPTRGPQAGRNFASRFFGVPKSSVELVGEEYQPDVWSQNRTVSPPLPGDSAVQLQNVLDALAEVEQTSASKESLRLLKGIFQATTGTSLVMSRWQESLYERLAESEVAYQIVDALATPRPLKDLVVELKKRLGRDFPEEEALMWLALGAASRKDGRPLLRPVVHAFVKGVSGAVVTFPVGSAVPSLWLSSEDASSGSSAGLFRLPVMTCTTCGQHYYVHHLADFSFTESEPGGGEAVDDRVMWRPLEESSGGNRVVLLDTVVTQESDGEEDAPEPANTRGLFFCRHCGTLHSEDRPRCDGCGVQDTLVRLLAVQQKEGNEGRLTRCVACGANGRQQVGNYREPARPVRALTVSDVHVLAQSMIQHAKRRRLLVFADNRQDAAFQSGWMRYHSRRYRLRTLIYDRILQSPVSVGDLTSHLANELDQDDDLSRALIPEVWRVVRKQSAPQQHETERQRYLRIQVLREVATGVRQRIGLEPWGRMTVEYVGLDAGLPFFRNWAPILKCREEDLRDGVASLLDITRRNQILLDREGLIFSRFWHESDREVQRGYMPLFQGGPKGLKLRRQANDDRNRVSQWLSDRRTLARQLALSWGVPDNEIVRFCEELWLLLTADLILLVTTTLTGSRGRPVPGCTDVTQIDADKLMLHAHSGVYRCDTCRRVHVRSTPNMACVAWHCNGTLRAEQEDPSDYNLTALDQQFAMLRPREHSAQIPADDREKIEREFKGDGERVNTLVCTPTLELGVDIGTLDSVLMRNVPPLPANYWQRAGRAGRQHRMAVNMTYARAASHDRAYFSEPLKMLEGLIHPPSFNLKNEVMVKKHVHATILSELHRLARLGSISQADRQEIVETLGHCFPNQVKNYLFDPAGNLLTVPFDVSSLRLLITKHENTLLAQVEKVFSQVWPLADVSVVQSATLRQHIAEVGNQLNDVIQRLRRRLNWALDQMRRLDAVRTQKATLDPEEDALYARCDRLVKKLKGKRTRRSRDAEGHDDTNTYSVLAAEGFLPGYGLDTGWIVGFYQAPLYSATVRDWELRRNKALALREYIPGNLIYANGHKFLPRFFHLETEEPVLFQVDTTNEAVRELEGGSAGSASGGLGVTTLRAVPICDVDLPHHSHISDDEDYRFQLSVAVFGYEQDRHGGGKCHSWGGRALKHRTGVHFRLVNVGAAGLVRNFGRLGYPICSVCGQSRSPFASQADRDNFSNDHAQRCGRRVDSVGFYADIVADAISLEGCNNRQEAYSIMEALRKGAAQVLEMDVEDLQITASGRLGENKTDIVLYDPMPGGSGLLDQMISRWSEVVQAAHNLVSTCPSLCETACIDCLCHFRNAHYQRYLDRHVADECFTNWGENLTFSNDIPARLPTPSAPVNATVNEAEDRLRAMLDKAGLQGYKPQHPIKLGGAIGTTTPDFFYDVDDGIHEGICIYLDGMCTHIHGNPSTRQRDREIREELKSRFFEVIEIPFGQLHDLDAMRRHLARIGLILSGKSKAKEIKDKSDWFEEGDKS